ncbi:putative nuclease HARBI1 [Ixodes scapularis]|uniref:putative nuclease HARBI1 n=1 Tax=Ixodes scapularis TaxID=6945 RepID=UPI001AD7B162|nr:putative nuclease HARBI1 [Ixodes scapularis]
MTVEQQLLCGLRFYATGSYQGQVVSDRHLAVHKTTLSACVRAVATAIVCRLGPRWIAFPETAEERAGTQEAFLRRGFLPGVVGCVDGTFIAIKGPSKYDPTVTKPVQKFVLRPERHAGCPAQLTTYMCGGVRGCARSASLVILSGTMRTCLATVGASWLMTPVPGRPALGTPAGQYNQAHASMRAVVERCIGLLNSRFRCLHRHRTIYHHPKIAGTIVAACAVLHSICLCSGKAEPEP